MYNQAQFPSAAFPSSSSTPTPNLDYPSNLDYYAGQSTTSTNSSSLPYNPSDYTNPSLSSGTMSPMSMGLSSEPGVDYDNEPPLLEELGINPKEIWAKTLAVSLPFRPLPPLAETDTDLAGPLCFCLLLGSFLLLKGKVHFGYIYGFGLIGCLLMYLILNLMSEEAISVDRTMSILGYSLLPIVLLSSVAILFDLRGSSGFVLSGVVIGWCTWNATRLFEKALDMREQRWLVAYPVTMLYACFALLTIF